MRWLLVLALVGCAPRVALSVRDRAATSLGPLKRVSILTHDTRIGVVMRERVRFELAKDPHFTVVPLCESRSCEPVDGFVRLYEHAATPSAEGVSLSVDLSAVFADGRPAMTAVTRARASPTHGEPPEKAAERLALDLAGEFARQLTHPSHLVWLELEDAAPFELGIAQALDGRLNDARKTFEAMLENNPRTAGACFNLAVLLEVLGQSELAGERYACAVAHSPKPEYRAAQAAFEQRQRARAALER